MKLAVISNGELQEAFLSKQVPDDVNTCFINDPSDIPADADVIFDLLFESNTERIKLLKQFLPRPVFINAVIETLAAIGQPFIRINAWPGFLKRAVTEIAVLPQQTDLAKSVFEKLAWNFRIVPDITGMVSPRIICAIINEAYYTLEEEVSTKEAIDIAMKLGTNYPYGPFEWSKKIGLNNLRSLLVQLNEENILYKVSTLLMNENIV